MGSSSSSSSVMQLCVCVSLQVNFRGSTGFGKSFLHAGDAEWGVGAMQNDLTDSVEWAVKQGIADPNRVAIFGGSYGQYPAILLYQRLYNGYPVESVLKADTRCARP